MDLVTQALISSHFVAFSCWSIHNYFYQSLGRSARVMLDDDTDSCDPCPFAALNVVGDDVC